MDSDDEFENDDNVDSGNVSSGDDDFGMEVDIQNSKERQADAEEYPYDVLTTDEIVQHMTDCIKEVNTVVQVNILERKNTITILTVLLCVCVFFLFKVIHHHY